jgi:long-chain acyl-CoA synthetase
MEWQITSEACHTQSMVTIALYDTLGEESSLFIMNHGEIVCLLISAEVFPQVAKIAAQCQYLKNLVVFEELSDKIKEDCNKLGLAVRSFSEVEELGKSARVSDVVPTADTLATIMYTSGTTGMPKGVMLTHRNIIAAVSGVTLTLMTITDQDVLISYLPLAHILERAAELVFFQNGACIGFTQGIIKEMLDDVQALRPTFFPAVPRVLDRFYDKIQGNVATSSKLKKWMFNKAIEGQKHKLGNPHGSAGLCAKLVIPKMKKLLGGRVRGMLSGGAPLNPKVHEFLQCAFDCSIVQGYGLTETCAACTIQLHYDTGLAQIGPPLASCEVKLVSVPEMNYLTTNEEPSGEILIRGANVSSGYYKDEEKTREVFDTDGWFHTGDVGKFNKNGTLSVIDRVKNIFKLSQGEYVAVENLELRLLSPYLARIWIYGDSLKSQLIAVGVVNPEVVQQYAKENNIAGSNIDEIIANPAIKKMILADLDKKGKEVKLKGFEFVKNIYLVSKDFDTVDGTTPTMKLKRNVLKNVYQNQLNEMYAELEKETPSA